MSHARRWWIKALVIPVAAGALAALVPFASAKPGIIRTRDNQTFEGEISEKGNAYIVLRGTIETRIDKRNVADISYPASLDDQYAAKLAKLDPQDVRGRIDLARWASDDKRNDLAQLALQEAMKLDPLNRTARDMLAQVESALALENRQLNTAGVGAPATATPPKAAMAAPVGATPPAGDSKSAAEQRLLTDDEINIIRQKELRLPDRQLRVSLANGVVRRYLATGDRNAEEFNKLSPADQTDLILKTGDPKLVKDVQIKSDPAALLEFRTEVWPTLTAGCVTSGCHGGTKAGNFRLYNDVGSKALYTNFFILQAYTKTVDGAKYVAMDRSYPQRSLVLQYLVSKELSDIQHPAVQGYRPLLRTKDDPRYMKIATWLESLSAVLPDYGINVSPTHNAAATPMASQPASQPAK